MTHETFYVLPCIPSADSHHAGELSCLAPGPYTHTLCPAFSFSCVCHLSGGAARILVSLDNCFILFLLLCYFYHLIWIIMSGEYECIKCGVRHAPPTGHKCRWQDTRPLLLPQEEVSQDLQALAASLKVLQAQMQTLQDQLKLSNNNPTEQEPPFLKICWTPGQWPTHAPAEFYTAEGIWDSPEADNLEL